MAAADRSLALVSGQAQTLMAARMSLWSAATTFSQVNASFLKIRAVCDILVREIARCPVPRKNRRAAAFYGARGRGRLWKRSTVNGI